MLGKQTTLLLSLQTIFLNLLKKPAQDPSPKPLRMNNAPITSAVIRPSHLRNRVARPPYCPISPPDYPAHIFTLIALTTDIDRTLNQTRPSGAINVAGPIVCCAVDLSDALDSLLGQRPEYGERMGQTAQASPPIPLSGWTHRARSAARLRLASAVPDDDRPPKRSGLRW